LEISRFSVKEAPPCNDRWRPASEAMAQGATCRDAAKQARTSEEDVTEVHRERKRAARRQQGGQMHGVWVRDIENINGWDKTRQRLPTSTQFLLAGGAAYLLLSLSSGNDIPGGPCSCYA
jgi:hypothetical protein